MIVVDLVCWVGRLWSLHFLISTPTGAITILDYLLGGLFGFF
jgi:hypothetical protein